MISDWRFTPSPPDAATVARRREFASHWRPGPASATLVDVAPASRWILYFAYLPDGELTDAHRHSLRAFAAEPAKLLVVCAAPTVAAVPEELRAVADALIWKGLEGFDFSAYAIGLAQIAERSPGADVFVCNDSVLGPFAPLDPLWELARWRLTGLTASTEVEAHLQSYAFMLAGVDPQTLAALAPVMPQGRALDDYDAVVLLQETRFARVAAESMSVGALWFLPEGNPTLLAAAELLERGHPFVKRSVFGKGRHLVDAPRLAAALAQRADEEAARVAADLGAADLPADPLAAPIPDDQAALGARWQELGVEVLRLRDELVAERGRLAAASAERDALRRELDDVRASRSWRLARRIARLRGRAARTGGGEG